ncbi:metallophosphoesterase [Simiduia sp. 21SJ11W-1]|uniref:metallophosphoesterase n=1 Tax=Simiduia sp. 21SJ11W-1 TaxID=2909669 RepID=UPI0020A19A3C|nr:metallophosphoesterase [Simiduia sp. 21SJ11W-1]UTA48310.1 metallophosphoesterase [Simiduia sp. 21SJ11W-1]
MIKHITSGLALLCLMAGSYAMAESITFSKRISNGNDDAEQRADGSMYFNSTDIELVYDGGNQTVGLRFQDIAVPKGATITNAHIQFTTDETNSNSTSLTIRAEATNSAAAFANSSHNISSRATTNASVNWQPSTWTNVGAAGSGQRTPNLKQLVQEVVSRNGWSSGNEMAFIITGSGERTAESYDGASNQAPLLTIEYQVAVQTTTISKRITSSTDDVEERADGSIYPDSTDLELTYDGSSQTVGLRFRDLPIAQGTTITNAYVQFTADEVNSSATNLTIRAEDVNNAAPFGSAPHNVSSRPTTSASVNWQPPAWNTVGAAGIDQRTPNLKNIIQEVVNRGGWQSGNELALIIQGTGERTAESFNGSASQAPQLVVEFEGPADNGGNNSEGVKIAFIGDTGTGTNFQNVLNLIAQEGAALTVVAGDTSYNATRDDNWDSMVRNTLGNDPAIIAAGNHDYGDSNFNDVRGFGEARLNAQSSVQCNGTYAEQMTCHFGNVSIVLSAIGSAGSRAEHETYISNSLNSLPNGNWRICAWHKNQRDMQVGGKGDEVGWTAYETCRQQGAIIATGHEHSYSRTHLLSDMSDKTLASTSSTFTVSEGNTFAFVSGLGGIGIRDQERNGNWWASIYTSTQGAKYGALFGTFYDDRAEFYFKNTDNQIIDQFTVFKGY